VEKVVWTRAALNDVRLIAQYIARFNPYAARRIAIALAEAGDSLGRFPERGRAVGPGRREMVAVRPYVILYRVEEGGIVILRIRHGRRPPQP